MSIVTLNDRAVRSVSTFGSLNTGNMIFIKKLTASSSANLTFLNGSSDVVFDSTYKEYLFTLKNIHPSANPGIISFQTTTDGTNYNTTLTTSYFKVVPFLCAFFAMLAALSYPILGANAVISINEFSKRYLILCLSALIPFTQ